MKRSGVVTIVIILGFLFFAMVLMSILVVSAGSKDIEFGEGIGVVEVTGPITGGQETIKQLRRFEESPNIKGIIVRIDSPGGAVGPSQEVYDEILRIRKNKKVVASMGNTAASGGYYIAAATDKIFANRGTVTGSIGVIMQMPNFTKIAEMAQLDMVTVKSGSHKDMGNPFRSFSEPDRQVFQALVTNVHEQFVTDIASARKMEKEAVAKLADGRVYTGSQAKEVGLVDELGGLRAAAAYLGGEAGIGDNPKLIYPPKKDEDVLKKLLEGAAQSTTEGALKGVRSASTPSLQFRYDGPQ